MWRVALRPAGLHNHVVYGLLGVVVEVMVVEVRIYRGQSYQTSDYVSLIIYFDFLLVYLKIMVVIVWKTKFLSRFLLSE